MKMSNDEGGDVAVEIASDRFRAPGNHPISE